MKKIACLLLSLLLALSAAGCGKGEEGSLQPGFPSDPADAVRVYRDLSFLTPEQRELFEQGEQIYMIFFIRAYELDLLYPVPEGEGVDENGNRLPLGPQIKWGKRGFFYDPTWGSYTTWEEMEAMVRTVFTEEGFRELSGLNVVDDPSDINNIQDLDSLNRESEFYPAFLNVKGRLYSNNGFYHGNSSLIDEYYELVEQTEDRVLFYRVCAYKEGYPRELSGGIRTYAFPVELLRTPEGWRIEQFTNGKAEPDPERKGTKHPSALTPAPEKRSGLCPETDFLTREQRELLKKGDQLYSLFFFRAEDLDDDFPASDEMGSGIENPWEHQISWGKYGRLYQPAIGRYRDWDVFEEMVLSVYTEDFFWEANDMDSLDEINEISSLDQESERRPAFLNVDGKVYCDTEEKDRNFDLIDEYYELVEQTEDRVLFYRICSYKGEGYPDKVSQEIRTYAFPIELLRTPEGWRIQQLANGRLESDPAIKGIERETVFLPAPEKPSSEPPSEPAEEASVYMELDFLSEEQQELFAKGERTYPLFRNRAEDIEADEFRDPAISDAEGEKLSRKDFEDRIEWGKYRWPYGPVSRSIYRNWDDFEKMILSIYTKECFWEMNGMNAVEDVRDINDIQDLNNLNRECEEYVAFLNVQGTLYGTTGVNTGNGSLIGEYYELIEQTEERVFFYRVCTYQNCYPYHSEQDVQAFAFPIELLRTPEGWRIQQFTDGRLELSPEIKGIKR